MSAPETYPQQPQQPTMQQLQQPSGQQYPPAPMPVPAMPQKPKRQRRYVRVWLPVFIGMVLLDVIGGLFVLVCFAAASDQSQTADFEQIASKCRNSGSVINADSEFLNIDFDYEGESQETLSQKAFNCVINELDMPNSVISKINSTRTIDGMQSDSWDGIKVTWTYTGNQDSYGDGEFNVTFEHAK